MRPSVPPRHPAPASTSVGRRPARGFPPGQSPSPLAEVAKTCIFAPEIHFANSALRLLASRTHSLSFIAPLHGQKRRRPRRSVRFRRWRPGRGRGDRRRRRRPRLSALVVCGITRLLMLLGSRHTTQPAHAGVSGIARRSAHCSLLRTHKPGSQLLLCLGHTPMPLASPSTHSSTAQTLF